MPATPARPTVKAPGSPSPPRPGSARRPQTGARPARALSFLQGERRPPPRHWPRGSSWARWPASPWPASPIPTSPSRCTSPPQAPVEARTQPAGIGGGQPGLDQKGGRRGQALHWGGATPSGRGSGPASASSTRIRLEPLEKSPAISASYYEQILNLASPVNFFRWIKFSKMPDSGPSMPILNRQVKNLKSTKTFKYFQLLLLVKIGISQNEGFFTG
jgi:hypothetical protein